MYVQSGECRHAGETVYKSAVGHFQYQMRANSRDTVETRELETICCD